MREIKFRAWNPTKNKMGIPFYPLKEMSTYNEEQDVYNRFPSECKFMQSTGLFDKNVKEIWEGDIIKVGLRDHKDVVFKDGAFGIDMTSSFLPLGMAIGSGLPVGDVEVIGNIYENKELLS